MAAQKADKTWFARHKILTIIGALIIIGIVGGAASGGSGTNEQKTGNEATSSETKQTTIANIGEPAKDGKFEFTVKSIECGKSSAGSNQYLTKTAQGQYCFLNVAVKNIGDEAQTLYSGDQKTTERTGSGILG